MGKLTTRPMGARAAAPARPWPAEDLETLRRCPVCRSTQRRPLYISVTDRSAAKAPGEWNVHRCSQCESGYLDPRPTPESMFRASSPTASRPRGEVARKLRRLSIALRNGYLNRKHGHELQPAHPIGYWIHALRYRVRARLSADLGWLQHHPPGRLLVIGTNSRTTVETATGAGWRVTLACLSDPPPDWASNLPIQVRSGDIPEPGASESQFDMVSFEDSLGRLHDPLATLKRCTTILAPNGRLRVSTPNLNAIGHGRYRRRWWRLDAPRTLIWFTDDSISRTIARAGFAVSERPRVYPAARRSFLASESVGEPAWLNPLYWVRRLRIEVEAVVADLRVHVQPTRAEDIVLGAAPAPFALPVTAGIA